MFVKSTFEISFCGAYVNFCGVVCCCDTSFINNIGLARFIFDWAAVFCSAVTRTFDSFIIIIDLFIVTAYESRNIWSAAVGYFNVVSFKYFIELVLFIKVLIQ